MSLESAVLSNHPILCLPLQSPFAVSLPASGSVPMSRLFASSGQSIGASAPALPMSMQGWFPLGLTVLISFQSKELSRVYSSNSVGEYPFFCSHQSLCFNSQPYMTNGKIVALTIQTFVGKVMSLPFNMLSRYVIAFLPRSKHILIISWLQSPSTWFWSPRK